MVCVCVCVCVYLYMRDMRTNSVIKCAKKRQQSEIRIKAEVIQTRDRKSNASPNFIISRSPLSSKTNRWGGMKLIPETLVKLCSRSHSRQLTMLTFRLSSAHYALVHTLVSSLCSRSDSRQLTMLSFTLSSALGLDFICRVLKRRDL